MTKKQNSRTSTEQNFFASIKTLYRDSYIKNNGSASVYIYVYLKREKVVFNSGVSVPPAYWDYSNNRIKRTYTYAADLNLIIENCRARINEIYVRYRLQHIELTPGLLKKEYKIPSTYIDFYSFLDKAMEIKKNELEPGTYRHHESVINKLKRYRPRLMFSEIDREFIINYQRYLKQTLKNKQNTINSNLNKLKMYLNMARQRGIIRMNPFDDIRLSTVNPDREYLTDDELLKLIELYKKNELPEAWQRSLRHFLFSCFTSLRISDVRELTTEMIVGNMIIYFPRKTRNKKSKPVRIPLTKISLKLMKDENPFLVKGQVFRMYADQNINLHLKSIASKAEIPKKINFHTARHTFATIFLRRTKNLMALKELLGHTNIRETMIYAHLLTDDLVAEMKIFDEFF